MLTYKIVDDEKEGQPPISIDSVVKIANRRISGGGKARPIDRKHFAIDLYHPLEESDIQKTKDAMKSTGFLEFRITADRDQPKDRSVIEAAKEVAPTTKEVTSGDAVVAEWVRYDEADFGSNLAASSRFVTRGAGDIDELLVLIDPFDVTGNYISSSHGEQDRTGHPAIVVSFDKEGSKRMQMLTSKNLPSQATPNLHRNLGIILDKKILSAPSLQTAIVGDAIISGGSMTKAEVDRIANVLNAGALPCPVRLVSEERVE